jgi:hypothetical protein
LQLQKSSITNLQAKCGSNFKNNYIQLWSRLQCLYSIFISGLDAFPEVWNDHCLLTSILGEFSRVLICHISEKTERILLRGVALLRNYVFNFIIQTHNYQALSQLCIWYQFILLHVGKTRSIAFLKNKMLRKTMKQETELKITIWFLFCS